MPTYQKADESVTQLATKLMAEWEMHAPLVAAEVKLDIMFAFGDRDDDGELTSDAITKNGRRALGLTRKISLKDRAAGRGDAEILLDGDYWPTASAEEQAALLDHELYHLTIKTADRDDLGRPQINLRKHDVEVGWFSAVADRHGEASQERIQAKAIMDNSGQLFWPDIAPSVQITSGGKTSKKLSIGTFAKAAATMA